MKHRLFTSVAALFLLASVAFAQEKSKECKSQKAKVFVFQDNGEEKTFVFEGDQSKEKVDSILKVHGVDANHCRMPQGKQVVFKHGSPGNNIHKRIMIKMDGDSILKDFDFDIDKIIDAEFLAGALKEYTGDDDRERMFKHRQAIVKQLHDKQGEHHKHVQMIHKKMSEHRKMHMDKNVIVMHADKDEVIVIKNGEKMENSDEIEIKTKKKKNETIITITKKHKEE